VTVIYNQTVGIVLVIFTPNVTYVFGVLLITIKPKAQDNYHASNIFVLLIYEISRSAILRCSPIGMTFVPIFLKISRHHCNFTSLLVFVSRIKSRLKMSITGKLLRLSIRFLLIKCGYIIIIIITKFLKILTNRRTEKCFGIGI
jgi:hypothetical protein